MVVVVGEVLLDLCSRGLFWLIVVGFSVGVVVFVVLC